MALCLGELASLEEQVQDGVARAADATVESLSLRRDRDHPEMVRLIASVRRRKVLQLERAAATRDVLAGLFDHGFERHGDACHTDHVEGAAVLAVADGLQ